MMFDIWYGDREKPIDTIEARNIIEAKRAAISKLMASNNTDPDYEE
ncbi:hypothetical protein ACFL43_00450 [Thermodesulfobacteriota bacterium]